MAFHGKQYKGAQADRRRHKRDEAEARAGQPPKPVPYTVARTRDGNYEHVTTDEMMDRRDKRARRSAHEEYDRGEELLIDIFGNQLEN